MGNISRRRYTQEFKQQAVALATEIGFAKAERKLGIPRGNVNNWKKTEKAVKSSEVGDLKVVLEENKKLKSELAEQKKINTILKAAAAFFSQDHLK